MISLDLSGELEIELERRKKIELRSVELETAFKKPKATEFELRQLEKGMIELYPSKYHDSPETDSSNEFCGNQAG